MILEPPWLNVDVNSTSQCVMLKDADHDRALNPALKQKLGHGVRTVFKLAEMLCAMYVRLSIYLLTYLLISICLYTHIYIYILLYQRYNTV